MALFLTRLWATAGMESIPLGDPVFVDIEAYPPTTRAAIEELAALGITSGVAPHLFDPHASVSRAEMALFLDRTLRALGVDVSDGPPPSFTDLDGQPQEVVSSVSRLAQLGVTTGTSETTFEPAGAVTREQMAAFLARFVTTISDESPSP